MYFILAESALFWLFDCGMSVFQYDMSPASMVMRRLLPGKQAAFLLL
jgi:hypothetical protein